MPHCKVCLIDSISLSGLQGRVNSNSPLSQASMEASNSCCSSIRSASFAISFPRPVPGSFFQDGCTRAALAALTARSTSSADAACTSTIGFSVLYSVLAWVLVPARNNHSRWINACDGLLARGLNNFIIDEQAQRLAVCMTIGSCDILE